MFHIVPGTKTTYKRQFLFLTFLAKGSLVVGEAALTLRSVVSGDANAAIEARIGLTLVLLLLQDTLSK